MRFVYNIIPSTLDGGEMSFLITAKKYKAVLPLNDTTNIYGIFLGNPPLKKYLRIHTC